MSRIKDLKTHPEHNVNIVDILSLITPTNKTKYIEMFLRIMKSTPDLDVYNNEVIDLLHSNFKIDKEVLKAIPSFQLAFYHKFLDSMFNMEDLKDYQKFCEFNERGLIEQNDLGKYATFQEISSQVDLAEMKSDLKEMESQIIKLYDDDTWLILRPLTYKSSLKYGANTKWCTASETNYDYFAKYATNGILIYCVNKKTGLKVACHKDLPDGELSFWNQKDKRIDSMQSELPMEILMVIKNEIDSTPISNSSFLTIEQVQKEASMYGSSKKLSFANEIGIPEPIREQPMNEMEMEVEEMAQPAFIGTVSAGRPENEAVPSEAPISFSGMNMDVSNMRMESLQPEIESINNTLRRG